MEKCITFIILTDKGEAKQGRIVQAWTDIHKNELLENFRNLRSEIQKFMKIKPLK